MMSADKNISVQMYSFKKKINYFDDERGAIKSLQTNQTLYLSIYLSVNS